MSVATAIKEDVGVTELDQERPLVFVGPDELKRIRAKNERFYLGLIYTFDAFALAAVSSIFLLPNFGLGELLLVAAGGLSFWLASYVSWKFLYWFVHGNSIRVSDSQYPFLADVVRQASEALRLPSVPTVFVLQGHGLLELFVAKRFSRRGMIVITSNLMDDLAVTGDTRRLMMIVGRQLGHIAAGHFHWWFLKDVVGALTFLLHRAYKRRCHYTADRIGYLICTSIEESEKALLTLTVGRQLAPETSLASVGEQAAEYDESAWAHFHEWLSAYPAMIKRIRGLEYFHQGLVAKRVLASSGQPINVVRIAHHSFAFARINTAVIAGNAVVSA